MNTTNPAAPSTPEELMRRFSDRVNTSDIHGLVALYEPCALFEAEPGVIAEGHDAIRAALEGLLALEPKLHAETVQVLTADGVALVINEWEMTGTAPDGTTVHRAGRSSDVVRRQPDGCWLVLIDRP
jgi:uncharacterized protein (TIGR02246 family)